MPLPIRMGTKSLNPFSSDLRGEQWAEPVPPKSDRFVADIDPTLVQKVLDISKRKRKPNVKHHCQADDLRARLEILEWVAFCHPTTLGVRPSRLKPFSFDSTIAGPNFKNHRRTVSKLTSMPRSANISSTSRKLSGNRKLSQTVRWIIDGGYRWRE